MLIDLKLVNFKCFEELTLDCTRLNLLTGVNGMGKSSVLQSLLVLRQSFETGELDSGRLVLGGDRIDLGSGVDVLCEDATDGLLGFALNDSSLTETWTLEFVYSQAADQLEIRTEGSAYRGANVPMSWREIPPFGGDLVYVNAERVGPRKMYPLSDVMARRGDFGPSGEFAWNYLNSHQDQLLSSEDPRYGTSSSRRLANVVEMWLQEVCPGTNLSLNEIRSADAVIPGFSFDRPGDISTRAYRATNVGFGLSYALPIILALLMPSGTLCLIENPEAHLHPRGQTKLAGLAVRAAMAGVQVFVETHSDHFIDGVRIAVRDGLISPEDTAFHFFEREDSKSVVRSPQVDSDGRLSEWPAGFFDQYEENLSRLLAPIN